MTTPTSLSSAAPAGKDRSFPHFRGNLQRTGVIAEAFMPPLALAWECAFGDEVRFPTIANGRIYFASLDANAYCYSLAGEEIWRYTTGARNNAGLMVYRDRCYFGSNDHGFYCLDARAGQLLWRQPAGAAIQGNFAAWEDTVICGAYDGSVYAFDAASGALRWQVRVGSGVNCSLAEMNGVIFFGTNGGTMHALDAATGATLWQSNAPGGINSTCAVSGKGVFTGTRAGHFCAFDAHTGQLRWALDFGAKIFASPALDDAHVYIASDRCTLRKLRIDDGAQVWETPIGTGRLPAGGQIWTCPLIAGDTVYIGPALGAIMALHRDTGAPLWSYPVEGPASSSVSIGEGVLATSTGGSRLLVFTSGA